MGLFCIWPSFLLLAGRPAVGVGSAVYLFFPGVVSVVLGMLCVRGVVGNMGAVVVAAWTPWRMFLRTLPPSASFFPPPGWLSLHILLPLPS